MPVLTKPEYPDAILVPTANIWEGRQGYTGPLTLVVHATAGFSSALDVAKYFQTNGGGNPVSAHFVIARDGTVYQCLSIHDSCYGQGGMSSTSGYWPKNINGNFMTIGIEHHKPSKDNSDIPTEAQYLASAKLSYWICEQLAIPKQYVKDTSGGICSHGFFDPANRSAVNGPGGDPGTFDWTHWFSLFTSTGGGIMPDLHLSQVADMYYLDGGNWHRKGTNFIIKGAILDYYVSLVSRGAPLGGMTVLGYPTENERQINPNYWIQRFERGEVHCEYPKTIHDNPPANIGTYDAHIEAYYAAADSLPTLNKTISDQSAQLFALHGQVTTLQEQIKQLQAQQTPPNDVYLQFVKDVRASLAKLP